MMHLLPEICALVTVTLLGLSLTLNRDAVTQKIREALFLVGMIAAAGFVLFQELPEITRAGLIEEASLFRVPRAAIFLCACVLSRMLAGTKQIPQGRKPESMFLLASAALIGDLLLLSKNLALSYVLLVILSWLGSFLTGLAYRGAREGEALLKQWVQGSVAIVIGAGGLVVVSALAGGIQYDQIAAFVAGLPEYSLTRLFMIAALYLPFLMVAGLFPFHLAHVDRDEGAPWAMQAILSVLVTGATVLSLWGMAVRVFTSMSPDLVPDGLRCLQLCGLVGGFWLAFFALSQKNSKRLFSGLMGGAWSVLLVPSSLHNPIAAAAVVYGVCAVLLWGTLLSFVWSRLQEQAGDESVTAIYGAGRVYRSHGLLLLFALASPMLFPAFPGFASVILHLASVIEQKTLLLLVFFSLLLILFCVIAARLAADLLFRRASQEVAGSGRDDFVRYDGLDIPPLAALLFGTLWLGILGNSFFTSLYESAKPFLN